MATAPECLDACRCYGVCCFAEIFFPGCGNWITDSSLGEKPDHGFSYGGGGWIMGSLIGGGGWIMGSLMGGGGWTMGSFTWQETGSSVLSQGRRLDHGFFHRRKSLDHRFSHRGEG